MICEPTESMTRLVISSCSSARQTRDDVLGEAVGEVFLYRIAAPILKWQHRNRWLVGQGERRPQRGGSLRPALLIVHHGLLLHGFGVRHFARPVRVVHAADETEAALVVRANQRLVRTVVPDHSTNGAHAGTQRRLRDDATLPYGVYQLFPANNSIAVANEMNKQIENLGLDWDQIARSS
jgi:hypothetical protein